MAVKARGHLRLEVHEFVTPAFDTISSSPKPDYTHLIASNVKARLDANSTRSASKVWSNSRTLANASETIDLTALTSYGTGVIDMTGLTMRFMKITAGTVGTTLTFTGGTNSYNYESEPVLKTNGAFIVSYTDGANPGNTIVSNRRLITVNGTVGDTYKIIIVAG